MEFDNYGRPITTQERPEDPIDEVIQITEQAWEPKTADPLTPESFARGMRGLKPKKFIDRSYLDPWEENDLMISGQKDIDFNNL